MQENLVKIILESKRHLGLLIISVVLLVTFVLFASILHKEFEFSIVFMLFLMGLAPYPFVRSYEQKGYKKRAIFLVLVCVLLMSSALFMGIYSLFRQEIIDTNKTQEELTKECQILGFKGITVDNTQSDGVYIRCAGDLRPRAYRIPLANPKEQK